MRTPKQICPIKCSARACLILIFIFLFHPVFYAQGEDVVLINGREIDTLRYVGYDDTPYQFTEWTKGNIIANNYHRFYDIKLNFNGYTQEFEVRRKNEFIELDAAYYLRIEVPLPESGDTILFQRGVLPGKPQTYVQLLFVGEEYLLCKTYDVELKTVSSRTVGGVIEKKRFTGDFNYYLLHDGKTTPLKLKKKKILSLFNKPGRVEEIIQKAQIDCREEAGITELFRLIEKTESR